MFFPCSPVFFCVFPVFSGIPRRISGIFRRVSGVSRCSSPFAFRPAAQMPCGLMGVFAGLSGCVSCGVPHRIPGGRERPLNPFFCNTDSAASSVLISGGISRAFRARAY